MTEVCGADGVPTFFVAPFLALIFLLALEKSWCAAEQSLSAADICIWTGREPSAGQWYCTPPRMEGWDQEKLLWWKEPPSSAAVPCRLVSCGYLFWHVDHVHVAARLFILEMKHAVSLPTFKSRNAQDPQHSPAEMFVCTFRFTAPRISQKHIRLKACARCSGGKFQSGLWCGVGWGIQFHFAFNANL